MRWKALLIMTAVVFVYLCLGGVGFSYLEATDETNHKAFIRNFTEYFLEIHRCVTEEEMESLVLTYIAAYDRGIIEVANTSSASNWDLASAVFFSITVVTTIGYGNIYPITAGGQVFAVIYALIGIPLCLALLGGIGYKLRRFVMKLDQKMICICCNKQAIVSRVFRILLILLIGSVAFIFLPAIMFVMLDGWTYREALYYSVITLTTIGFGDLVPGLEDTPDTNRTLYRVMLGFWIFIGLAWVASVIAYMQELYTQIMKKASNTLEEKDESINSSDEKPTESKIRNTADQHTLSMENSNFTLIASSSKELMDSSSSTKEHDHQIFSDTLNTRL